MTLWLYLGSEEKAGYFWAFLRAIERACCFKRAFSETFWSLATALRVLLNIVLVFWIRDINY